MKDTRNSKNTIQSIADIKKIFCSYGTDFSFLYSRVALSQIIVMSLSSGIPLLYFLNLAFLIALYKIERKFFLRDAVMPERIGEEKMKFLLKVTSFAVWFHLMIGAIQYSDTNLFPVKAQHKLFGKFNPI